MSRAVVSRHYLDRQENPVELPPATAFMRPESPRASIASSLINPSLELTARALTGSGLEARVHDHRRFSTTYRRIAGNVRDDQPAQAEYDAFWETNSTQESARFSGTPLAADLKPGKSLAERLALYEVFETRLPYANYQGIPIAKLERAAPLYAILQALVFQGANRAIAAAAGEKVVSFDREVAALDALLTARFTFRPAAAAARREIIVAGLTTGENCVRGL